MSGVNEKSFRIEGPVDVKRLIQFLQAQRIPFQVDLGPIREPRSLSQNDRLWALHRMAAAETGHTPDELHELMLAKFFGTKIVDVGDVTIEVPAKRSSAREKQEFREFLENVENFYASELGVWLSRDGL